MIRYEILELLKPVITAELVVCNIGSPSQELHEIDDQPSNFHMLGPMGLGLALGQEKPVIASDGEGSVLTNMGTLATIGNNPSDNFILLIVDNGSYGSTGDQPAYTSGKTSLAKMAEACGCENVVECTAAGTAAAVKAALASNKMTIIVSKCDSGNRKCPVITMNAILIRERFMAEVAR